MPIPIPDPTNVNDQEQELYKNWQENINDYHQKGGKVDDTYLINSFNKLFSVVNGFSTLYSIKELGSYILKFKK